MVFGLLIKEHLLVLSLRSQLHKNSLPLLLQDVHFLLLFQKELVLLFSLFYQELLIVLRFFFSCEVQCLLFDIISQHVILLAGNFLMLLNHLAMLLTGSEWLVVLLFLSLSQDIHFMFVLLF